MRGSKLYNQAKKRKATANEIAKYIIIDRLESLCAFNEVWGLEDLEAKELEEVSKFFGQHLDSLMKRFGMDTSQFTVKA